MKKIKTITHLSMLVTTPSLFAYPQNHMVDVVPQKASWLGDWWWGTQQESEQWVRPTTYDGILQLLEEIESDELERKYSPEELVQINDYLAILAYEGILPNEFAEEAALEEDVYDLMYGEDSAFQVVRYLESSHTCMIIPAVFNTHLGYNIVQCGKISNAWKKTKTFVKKHKKAIIIGAVIVVAVTVVAVAVVAASSASAAAGAAGVAEAAGAGEAIGAVGAVGAAGAAAASGMKSEPSESNNTKPQTPLSAAPTFQGAMEDQINSFKEHLAGENFFQPSEVGNSLPIEERGRVAGSLFAHDSFNHFNNEFSKHPQFSGELRSMSSHADFAAPLGASDDPVAFGHTEIDSRFSSSCGFAFSDPSKEVDIDALSYQMRGEAAHSHGYYDQAIHDFSRAIEKNPADPILHLQRSASYFDMGQYDKSIEDFNTFSSQIEQAPEKIRFSTPEFTISFAPDLSFAFARGMSKGAYIAVKDLASFVGDSVTHPIQTFTQVIQSICMLVDLTKNNEWGQIADCLVPEARQLINEWETLPPNERAERSGAVFMQCGGEIFLTGGIVKAGATAAKIGAKSVQNVARAARGFKMARETLLLEAAAEIGSAAKVGEMVASGRNTLFLGRELGFTAKEMGQLQKAGKLEATLQNKFHHLSLPKQESINLFREAEKFLRGHKGFRPEHEVRNLIHQTGIPTFTRPKGIPENYRVKLSNDGAGMKYVHPRDEGTYVRVMPGKPHSPNSCQQKPYVNHRVNGESVDKFGNKVLNDSKEAHISLEEFIYRDF